MPRASLSWNSRCSRRARSMLEKNQRARRDADAGARARSAPSKRARHMILRLLGEASTLRNQLAQIGRISGRHRTRAHSRAEAKNSRRRPRSSAWAARKQLSETYRGAADGTGDHRRRAGARPKRRWRPSAGTAAEIAPPDRSGCVRNVSRHAARNGFAGEHPVAPQPTRRNRVKRLFDRARKGQAGQFKPGRRAGRFRGSGPGMGKRGGRVPARRAGIRGGAGLGAGREGHGSAARRNWTAAPRSWCKAARRVEKPATAAGYRSCRAWPISLISQRVCRARRAICCLVWPTASWRTIGQQAQRLAEAYPISTSC